MREYSIPAMVDVPAAAGLADVVFTRASKDPHAVVIRRPAADGRWEDVTAGQFRDDVTALAKGLVTAGIEPGDRVALMSRTRYEWTLADYAIWTAGAVTVPVYETSSADQIDWILSDSGARAAFAETAAHADLIRSVSSLDHLWVMDGQDGLALDQGTVTDEELEQRRAARTAADLATIIYTSGTTGRPKGCEITHLNLLSDVRNAVAGALAEVFEIAGSSTLLFLPLAHSFARIIQVGCLESGAILGHWADSSSVATVLPTFQPTFLLAVPRVFEKAFNSAQQQASASGAKSRIFQASVNASIAWSQSQEAGAGATGPGLRLRHGLFDRLVYAKLRAAMGGQLQFAVSGGAPLGERLGHFFRGAGIMILEGYGLTETSAAATVNRPGRNKIGTVGLPLPGVAIKIDDDGEILLRGPNVFPGYWHNKEATAEVLDSGGWFRSGDIGGLDEEGFLQVTGRKKELIVTAGGKNVAPAVLEDRLRAHPLISQTLVVGDGRPFIAALITLDPEGLEFWRQQHGKPADADLRDDPDLRAEIQSAVDDANKAVSRAESIRSFRILASDFTEGNGYLTPSLKVKRNVVLADYADDIAAIYAKRP
ncbi:MAG TPA: long-chain fatty acid--CoA ligase [Streptosporangiaceae bacterium]|nr:long-chain fatty acid--CoA ligase [Streptosporangiaceae bacterium]